MDPNDRKDEECILAEKQLSILALHLPIPVPSLEVCHWVVAQSYSCQQEQAVQVNLRGNLSTAGVCLWFVGSSSRVECRWWLTCFEDDHNPGTAQQEYSRERTCLANIICRFRILRRAVFCQPNKVSHFEP